MNDKPKRHRFRYSLRTLLVFVTIAGAGFGWLGYKVRQAERQRKAVQEIRQAGGKVRYDYHGTREHGDDNATPPGPTWLRTLLGEDLFVNAVDVYLSELSDAEFVSLSQLPMLNRLDVESIRSDNKLLSRLPELSQLRSASFYCTEIGDAGLIHLSRITQLQTLVLHGTGVTDAGMIHLGNLTHLQSLAIGQMTSDSSHISDAGLIPLNTLTNLKELSLVNTNVTDAGLAYLQCLPQLEKLYLTATHDVTDAGLAHLHAMARLKVLKVGRTRVTDAGLVHLRGLKQLNELDVQQTQVTDEGCQKLRKILPNLYISR